MIYRQPAFRFKGGTIFGIVKKKTNYIEAYTKDTEYMLNVDKGNGMEWKRKWIKPR